MKNPGTGHPVCAESDDEDDDPQPKPPSHAEAVNLCEKLIIYLQSLPDTHHLFPYVYAIQNLTSQKQFISKNQWGVSHIKSLRRICGNKRNIVTDVRRCKKSVSLVTVRQDVTHTSHLVSQPHPTTLLHPLKNLKLGTKYV